MAEECIIVTFGVDERHSKCCCDAQLFCARPPASLRWVDRGRAKWIASLEPTERSVFVFKHDSAYIDKEFYSGHSLLSKRCQSFSPEGQNHRRFRLRLAGTRAGAEPA
ncbi:hypothetical protein SBA7_380006 [Candidatus Sulfotelmatobacter sp. SbA7]|nr:hypothetical protein SBA7_380006 [Candidatus Sulfotelmatobacter sp. SbA7]